MRRGKTGKHKQVGVKRKWWVLGQPPYSQKGNGRQLPRVEPGDRPSDVEENPGSRKLSKVERTRLWLHSGYIHIDIYIFMHAMLVHFASIFLTKLL